MHTATDRKLPDVVELLIKHGADINSRTGFFGIRLAMDTLQLPDKLPDVVEILRQTWCRHKHTGSLTRVIPLLHFAIDRQLPDGVELLIKHVADINIQNVERWAVSNFAIDRHLRDLVRFLIKHGADINSRTKKGWTPIHRATDSK